MTKRFNLSIDFKAPSTPLPYNFKDLPFNKKASSGNIYLYQQKVGSINYITVNIRPDIIRVAL